MTLVNAGRAAVEDATAGGDPSVCCAATSAGLHLPVPPPRPAGWLLRLSELQLIDVGNRHQVRCHAYRRDDSEPLPHCRYQVMGDAVCEDDQRIWWRTSP